MPCRDALRMVKNTLSSVKRDAAIGQQAQAARQHQQRLHTLFPAGREAADVPVLDGPGESRPSGHARHNNDPVSFRHAPMLLAQCCWEHQPTAGAVCDGMTAAGCQKPGAL